MPPTSVPMQALVPLLLVAYYAGFAHHSATSASLWEADWVRTAEGSVANTNVTWFDDGDVHRYRFAKYGEKKTYCFYPNATLSFRMEPLTSPSQPYVVQWLGQFEAAHVVANFAAGYMTQLQERIPLIRSLLWPWSDLPVKLTSKARDQLHLTYIGPTSTPCRMHEGFEAHYTPFVDQFVPEKLQYVLALFRNYVALRCESFHALPCDGFGNECFIKLSPFEYPCITVHGPTSGIVLANAQVPFTIASKTYVDMAFARNFLLGLFVYFSAETLATNRLFHYALGTAISIVFSLTLPLYWMSKLALNVVRRLPGGRALASGIKVASSIMGLVLLPVIYNPLCYLLDLLYQFWLSDSVMDVPHLGKLYVTFFGLVGGAMVHRFHGGRPTQANLRSAVAAPATSTARKQRSWRAPSSTLQSISRYLAWRCCCRARRQPPHRVSSYC
ncbi:hypothetical protein SDRG_08547 [Saprolegnia diclina VS20]|uniref:Uncharacterized protein n=1 Tax=Saprolegnia diclina (strain VS20) TaxID=1156394 RepID=T0QGJ3_SAPDV|nr:hypothetical protein SDRG_08547 [Saprolegnia diclina VS20]EQC33866.1 hypothetical protein SDRG_08547 [Saprolegnia diclina VS20]|eukprot:XP_008612661.1 hypothetical protein SDRG_08547 [Saprolegnia diclina VS20]